MDITPEYIRGVFDSEGCVYIPTKLITISNTNRELLEQICLKLNELGVKTHWHKYSKEKPYVKQCYGIRIHDYYSIRNFYHLIGSNHKMKKRKMLELLYSYIKKPLSKTEKEKIKELRGKGHTYQEIADYVHRSTGSVYNIVSKM